MRRLYGLLVATTHWVSNRRLTEVSLLWVARGKDLVWEPGHRLYTVLLRQGTWVLQAIRAGKHK